MSAGPSPAGPWGWTEGAFLSPALSLLLCKPPPAGLGAPHRVTRCRLSPSLPPQYPVATPLSPLGVSGTSGRDPACCSPSAAPSPGLGALLRVLGGPPSRGLHCSPPVPLSSPGPYAPVGPGHPARPWFLLGEPPRHPGPGRRVGKAHVSFQHCLEDSRPGPHVKGSWWLCSQDLDKGLSDRLSSVLYRDPVSAANR